MLESYCGKCCEDCPKHQDTTCVGCTSGLYSRDCEIARCCREKGHEGCGSCTYVLSCRTRMDRDQMPEKLLDQRRREEELYQTRMAKAQLLGKWLWPIFWCMIASTVVGLLDLEFITNTYPIVGHISTVITTGLSVYIGWCYLQLAPVDDRYRFVGLVQIGLLVNNIAGIFLPDDSWIMILLLIPVLIFSIMSEYRRCMAHSDALSGISDELAEKWKNQWKLFKIALIGTSVCIALFFVPMINIAAIFAFIGFILLLLFVGIRDYVYLYKTADLFRPCPGER